MFKSVTAALLAVAALVSQAQAGVISGVTVSSVSSQIGSPFARQATNLVSGAGFNSTPGGFSITPDGTMWLSNGNGAFGGGVDLSPSITFDLGAIYALSSARVWNYNENSGGSAAYTARGVSTMTVSTSTDGTTFGSFANITLTQAPGSDSVDFSQSFGLNGSAEFIRFANMASFGGDYGFVGLSQVQFSGLLASAAQDVPEPVSMLLLGCGVLAMAASRRRSLR